MAPTPPQIQAPQRVPATSSRQAPPASPQNGGAENAPDKDNKKPQETPKKHAHRIKNFEWGLLITVAVIVDIIQIILNFFVVGAVINRFITIVGGIIVPVFFYLRGINMDSKKWTNIVGSFVLELIPVIDVLPAWTRLIFRIMTLDKMEEKLEQAEQKIPGGQLAGAMVDKKLGAKDTAGGNGVPPVIGASGRPMAEPGTVPPRIGSSGLAETDNGEVPPVTGSTNYPKTPEEQKKEDLRNEEIMSLAHGRDYGAKRRVAEDYERREYQNRLLGNSETADRYGAEARRFRTQYEEGKARYEPPSKNIIDLRGKFNPKHERMEGDDEDYKQVA